MKKKLFKDNVLFSELHPTKNQNIDFSKIYDSSSWEVIWQCPKDKRHIYPQRIRSKTKEGHKCPYCSKSKTLPEESLASLYPEITTEIHPDKNSDFDPSTRSPTSNKKIVWLCSNGHEWTSRIDNRTKRNSKCPKCRIKENSLASKFPNLLEEWHPTENTSLNPWKLKPSSNAKVLWQCTKNPQHSDWLRTINTRTKNDKGCPECRTKVSNNLSKPIANTHPKLSIYSPELATQWHPLKNLKKPSDFLAGSSMKAWWICPACKHEWKAVIRNRAIQNKGCPICAHSKMGKHSKSKLGNLTNTHPELTKQWHKSLNKDIKPENCTYGSAKKIWWQCPAKEEHVWTEEIRVRTKRGTDECRVCKKEANSLQAIFPEIAEEWHPTKNGHLKPIDVSKASGEMVWWQCSVNPEHQWQADVRNRTNNKSKCKKCAGEKIGVHLRNPDQDLDPIDVDTYHIFKTNLDSLSLLLEYSFDDNKRLVQPVFRMIYSSVITALESYLSDTFLNKIKNNNNRIIKIVSSSSELNTRKYSIEEIIDWQDNVETKVIEFLSNIIWHKIDKVRRLYKDVLEIKFPNNSTAIFKAVEIRHDLVHRNGRIKEGSRHNLTKSNVEALINETNKFVLNIQNKILKIE